MTGIRLRRAGRADAAWLEKWLPAFAASLGYEYAADRLRDMHIITHRRQPVGVIIVRAPTLDSTKHQSLSTKRQSAIIELVATPQEHARRGYGLHAAALLEDQLRRRGIRCIYAPAPASHGIATYFWIRLGYRPLLRPAWPCSIDGVAWLSRDLQGSESGAQGARKERKASERT